MSITIHNLYVHWLTWTGQFINTYAYWHWYYKLVCYFELIYRFNLHLINEEKVSEPKLGPDRSPWVLKGMEYLSFTHYSPWAVPVSPNLTEAHYIYLIMTLKFEQSDLIHTNICIYGSLFKSLREPSHIDVMTVFLKSSLSSRVSIIYLFTYLFISLLHLDHIEINIIGKVMVSIIFLIFCSNL